jgi:hypothetical protein
MVAGYSFDAYGNLTSTAPVSLYLGPVAGGAAAGLVDSVGTQLYQNGGRADQINSGDAALATVEGGLLGGGRGAKECGFELRGGEFRFGNDFRIAPFGNNPGARQTLPQKLPHYHRRGEGKGQGIGRHRPWDVKEGDDGSFGARF